MTIREKEGDTMISSKQVEQQLKTIGCHYSFWGSTEVAELANILMDDEEIAIAINGYYEGGFGLLVATNLRVLIVDKKPFVLNVEDLRYEMMTEVTYGARLLIADMHIAIPTRTIYFDSWSMTKLHAAMRYIQKHVSQARDGATPQVSDWFKTASAVSTPKQSKLTIAEIMSRVARAAFLATSAEKIIKSPSIGYSSSMTGINPYARRVGANLRRRLPAFYH